MLLKLTTHLVLFLCLAAELRGKPLQHRDCFECGEEVWEEVPCHNIPNKFRKVTPKPTATLPKSTKQYTTKPAVTKPAYLPLPTTTSSPVFTTPKDPYRKCYYQCKLGCKEFCHKVAINPQDKQIIQVSKISEPAAEGDMQLTHILQRKLIPKIEQTYHNYNPKSLYNKHKPVPAEAGIHSSYAPHNNPDNILSVPLQHVYLNDKIIDPTFLSTHSSPTPVNNDLPFNLDKYDDSLSSLISRFIENNPTNHYQNKPIYSVSYNR